MSEIETEETYQPVDQDSRVSMSEFLESFPPNQAARIEDLSVSKLVTNLAGYHYAINTPPIQIHCTHESCNGPRFFRSTHEPVLLNAGKWAYGYLNYFCANCLAGRKTYSIAALLDNDSLSGGAIKLGEIPVFGPPTPARLIKLVGPDRELFLKGRQCENQGLGVGAFTYYRRVVENQKHRILSEFIKVARKLNAGDLAIAELEAALDETQFHKAISIVKHGIPQALFINGHNPLTLLHDALSYGVHTATDEDCLKVARSVRVLLIELSERLGQALKDEAELNNAITNLLNVRKK